jgi:hypothetical protein
MNIDGDKEKTRLYKNSKSRKYYSINDDLAIIEVLDLTIHEETSDVDQI